MYMDHLPENKGIRGRLIYSMSSGRQTELRRRTRPPLKAWADGHDIPLLLNHRVKRIIKNNKGEIAGVEAIPGKNSLVTIRAAKAVVFVRRLYA